jgi:hypothetical protein
MEVELLEEITDDTENKIENESNLTLYYLYLNSRKLIPTVEIHLEILKTPITLKHGVSIPPPQLHLMHSHPLNQL